MTTSHAVSRTLAVASVLAALLAVASLRAAGPVTVTVAFSAPAQAKLEHYGKDEGAGLQLAANPSLDPVRTRSLGGADLTGVLRDSRGQVLATVKHQHYPPTLRWRSPSLEPWADAGIAIEQFASQMGKACRRAPAG